MFRERYEEALRRVSDRFPDDLKAARKAYEARTSPFDERDACFEERISAFLEWFFFDWTMPSTNTTPLAYCRNNATADTEDLAFFDELTLSAHGLFEIRSLKPETGCVALQNLLDLSRYDVRERRMCAGIAKGDLIDARIFPHRDGWLFTDSILLHPRRAAKILRKRAKAIRKTGSPEPSEWLIELVRLRWHLERYPRLKPEVVYAGTPTD